MREKTCCFTGHRAFYDDISLIKSTLKTELIQLIDNGMRFFGAGGARGFDALAAQTVLELKSAYPHIRLILVLPCANQTRGWSQEDIEIHADIKRKADKVRVLSENYYNGCMHARNRHMVDCSSACICYLRRTTGGTAYTVHYAKQNGLQIIRI